MNRLVRSVPITAARRQRLIYGLLVAIGLWLLTACQPITAPAVAPTAVPATTNRPVPPSATPTNFAYLVRITDGDDQPLARAHVLIEVQGAADFDA